LGGENIRRPLLPHINTEKDSERQAQRRKGAIEGFVPTDRAPPAQEPRGGPLEPGVKGIRFKSIKISRRETAGATET